MTLLAEEPRTRLCEICGSPDLATRHRCVAHAGMHRRENARIDSCTRFEGDPECQRFVDEHPHGASLEEIGDALGLVRESVRQIEERALVKLAKRLALLDVRAEDAVDYLAFRARIREAGPWG